MFQFEFTFKFEYQIRFSGEYMSQYITTLYTYEHNQILFHVVTLLIMKNESYHNLEHKP